jgi:nucleotide-binding universal stress UspA family protein
VASNKRILVAVDESKASRRAVAYVGGLLGGRPGFCVGLFHLEVPPRMLEWGGSEDVEKEDRVESERDEIYQELEVSVKEKGETLLRRSQAVLSSKGIEVRLLPVKWEEPLDHKNLAQDILQTARQGDYGTVVVGRNCYSRWQRLFHHPVADDLVREGCGLTVWVVE